MNRKAMMVNQIKEIARQRYDYIDLNVGLSVLDEVLGDQEVLAFYVTDRIIRFDFRYADGIQATAVTDSQLLYSFEIEPASIRYDFIKVSESSWLDVRELLPSALLPRKDRQIQMELELRLSEGTQGATLFADATPEETKALREFIVALSNCIRSGKWKNNGHS